MPTARLLSCALVVAGAGCGRSPEATPTSDVWGSSSTPTHLVAPSHVVAPMPPESCDRGPIRFAEASAEDRAKLQAEFQRRNGVLARDLTLDALGRYVVLAFGFGGASASGHVATDDEKEANARAFLVRNADLLGVAPGDIAEMTLHPWSRSGAIQHLTFRSSAPLPGYESFELRRDLRLGVGVDSSGEIRSTNNGSMLLPAFNLCKEPLLRSDDPRVRGAVVGKSTFFHTIASKRVDVGPATEADLGEPKLTVLIRPSEHETVVFLAYAMAFFGRGFTALVDANTGEFLTIHQNFVT